MGLGSSFTLPRGLRDYLEDFGIVSLAHARNYTSNAKGYWFSAEELDLTGDWKLIWDNYIRGLEFGRIRLTDQSDMLIWSHNNYFGPLTAAEGYSCIISHCCPELNDKVLKILWSLPIPLKIKCFIWLLIYGKILTWEQLQSRGISGPSRCILCEGNLEDLHHLFFCCPFSARIYTFFERKFSCSFPSFSSVHSYLDRWFTCSVSSAPYLFLPLFICWGIWLTRNFCIFEDKKPSIPALIARIEGLIISFPVPLKICKARIIGPKPTKCFPCGFFDGAAAENLGGFGFMIYINDMHFFSFSMGCGRSSNTRAELLACWAILKVSLMMGIPIQQIYGDSLVIISWINRISALDVPSLMHWCCDIRHILQKAPPVIFKHTYREHNSLADALSKLGLKLDMGVITYSESLDGLIVNQGNLYLF